MQIAVCDDERETRDMLAEKIRRFYPQAEVILYQYERNIVLGCRRRRTGRKREYAE